MYLRLSIVTLLIVVGVLSAAAADLPSKSAPLAKELSAAMTAQHLEAIAAKDPEEPDRFIAALFVPGGELLVVSARYQVPTLLDAKLASKDYRGVYADLQSSAVPKSSVFFEDLNADGLCAGRDQAADLLYDASPAPTIFDGNWDKHKISEKTYAQLYSEADHKYATLLARLLTQITSSNQHSR
jgi:hypothetical protein